MKQEILDKIKTIQSGLGLSGYLSSLPKVYREDEVIINAFKNRKKQL